MALGLPLAACANAPSVPVLGAYFPDWLFCILVAALLGLPLHAVLARRGWVGPAVLTFPLLTALLALGAWLLVFQG